MKKALFVICAIFLVYFSSCGNEDVEGLNSEQDVLAYNTLNDLEIIASLGLDTIGLVDDGDFYIVEGDIILDKKSLIKKVSDSVGLKQVMHVYLVDVKNVKDITIFIPSEVPIEWRNAIRQAITEWNNVLGSAVKMREVNSSDAHIKVMTEYTPNSEYIAFAQYPKNDGKPGAYIKINTIYNYLPASEKLQVMVHELGHNLGLAHTDKGGLPIPGTPVDGDNPDPNSVMNHRSTLWNGFSQYDILAIQYLYPAPFSIVPSRNNLCPNELVTYTLPHLPSTGMVVSWNITSGNAVLVSSTYNSATFKAIKNGGIVIVASVNYGKTKYQFKNTDVWVGLQLPSSLSINGTYNTSTSSNYTYSVNCPAGYSVVGWTVDSPLKIVSVNSDRVTIATPSLKKDVPSVVAHVTAEIKNLNQNACGSALISRQINVVNPNYKGEIAEW